MIVSLDLYLSDLEKRQLMYSMEEDLLNLRTIMKTLHVNAFLTPK